MSESTSLPMIEDMASSLGGRAAAWLGLRSKRVGLKSPDLPFLQFAESVADASSPKAVADALVKAAQEISGARRVELVRDRGWGTPILAAWPVSPNETGAKRSSLPLRDEDWLEGRSPKLGVPARHAGRTIATLWLYAEQPQHWPEDLVKSLTALATLAASSGFAPDETTEPLTTPAHDLATSLPNASFLEAFLTYAVAQAKRKHEPFSMICIGIDRIDAIRKLHGPELARDASRLMAKVIAATLRSSDLVARLDDSRLIAVLPNARSDDALLIATTLREAIENAGKPTTTMPLLTASFGVVSFPEHASEAPQLLRAATEALVEARARGQNEIFSPPLPGVGDRLRVAQCAG